MNRLREFRKAYDLTQQKLAAKCHMRQNKIVTLEYGRELPWPREAEALAICLDTTPETLFPEGCKVRCDYGKHIKAEDDPPYQPDPEPALPVRHYPHEFRALCYHCHRVLPFRADDNHYAAGNEPHEPSCLCGAVFYDIAPIEEAMHV